MKKSFAAIILCLALLLPSAGCGPSAVPESSPTPAPEEFSLRFSWWYSETQKNIMDTQTGFLQKDLIADGTATAKFEPSPELLRRLFDIVSSNGLTDIEREMTSQVLAVPGTNIVAIEPLLHYELSVTVGGRSYLIRGDRTAAHYTDADTQAAGFMSAVEAIMQEVRQLPEWTALPEESGGYS